MKVWAFISLFLWNCGCKRRKGGGVQESLRPSPNSLYTTKWVIFLCVTKKKKDKPKFGLGLELSFKGNLSSNSIQNWTWDWTRVFFLFFFCSACPILAPHELKLEFEIRPKLDLGVFFLVACVVDLVVVSKIVWQHMTNEPKLEFHSKLEFESGFFSNFCVGGAIEFLSRVRTNSMAHAKLKLKLGCFFGYKRRQVTQLSSFWPQD
jgi:hypothetical protein